MEAPAPEEAAAPRSAGTERRNASALAAAKPRSARKAGKGRSWPEVEKGVLARIGDRGFSLLAWRFATVDQLNGVWNSEWERANPFGPAGPATRKPSSQSYITPATTRRTRAPRSLRRNSTAAFVFGLNWQRQVGPIVPDIADHFANRPDSQRCVGARLEQRHQLVLGRRSFT